MFEGNFWICWAGWRVQNSGNADFEGQSVKSTLWLHVITSSNHRQLLYDLGTHEFILLIILEEHFSILSDRLLMDRFVRVYRKRGVWSSLKTFLLVTGLGEFDNCCLGLENDFPYPLSGLLIFFNLNFRYMNHLYELLSLSVCQDILVLENILVKIQWWNEFFMLLLFLMFPLVLRWISMFVSFSC